VHAHLPVAVLGTGDGPAEGEAIGREYRRVTVPTKAGMSTDSGSASEIRMP
jgi:hypothetical protein